MGRFQKISEKYPTFVKIVFYILNRIPFFNYGMRWKQIVCEGLLQNCKSDIKGKDNLIKIGKHTRLVRCKIYINGNYNRIDIGDNCCLIDTEFFIEDDTNHITIGNNTSIAGSTQLAAIEGRNIIIGDNCLFSSDVKVRTGDSHAILDLDHNRINPSKDVIVQDHVWIGNRVTILKGAVISHDSVIGAAAVLSGQYTEPNCVYAGNPARKIKSQITWNCERKI